MPNDKHEDLRTPEEKIGGKLRKKIKRAKDVKAVKANVLAAPTRPVRSAKMSKRLYRRIFGM